MYYCLDTTNNMVKLDDLYCYLELSIMCGYLVIEMLYVNRSMIYNVICGYRDGMCQSFNDMVIEMVSVNHLTIYHVICGYRDGMCESFDDISCYLWL